MKILLFYLLFFLSLGNITLTNYTEDELTKKFLCSKHFTSEMYLDGKGNGRLKQDAVPVKYVHDLEPQPEQPIIDTEIEHPLKVRTPVHVYSHTPVKKTYEEMLNELPGTSKGTPIASPSTKALVRQFIDMPDEEEVKKYQCRKKLELLYGDDTPRKVKLKKTIKRLQNSGKNKNQKLYRLKHRAGLIMAKYKARDQEILSRMSENSAALVSMQLKGMKKKKLYTKSERKLALLMFYKGSGNYSFLRRNKIVLPGESTVRKWIRSNVFEPGINKNLVQNLEMKCSHMNILEKAAVILFDEMSIMKALEYNKTYDYIEGLEDLGGIGRTPKWATHALVIMIRGLYSLWKMSFAYYFTSENLKGKTLKIILEDAIQKIIEIGFIPKVVVCDQAPTNRKLYNLWNITPTNNQITIGNMKIFCMHDVPHLFKSVRNNLLTGDFIDASGNVISFQDIKKTYDIDERSTTVRAMPKITPAHINPNSFQKMSCKLALQLFSNTASGAVKSAVDNGELSSPSAMNTAEFLLNMNDLFDSLNSNSMLSTKPHEKPLCQDFIWHFVHFDKMTEFFKNLQKINKKKGTLSRPPCFDGLLLTLQVVQDLFTKESSFITDYKPYLKSKKYFLFTRRLNQDPLENFFSVVRQRNGYNRNPSARGFRTAFAQITNFAFIKYSEQTNCMEDEDVFLSLKDLNEADKEANRNAPKTDQDQVMETEDEVELEPEMKDDEDEIEREAEMEEDNAEIEEENETEDNEMEDNEMEVDKNDSDDSECPFEFDSDDDEISQTPFEEKSTQQQSSIAYFAGYVARRLKKEFNCEKCEKYITEKGSGDELPASAKSLINAKNYQHVDESAGGGLIKPSKNFSIIIREMLEICHSSLKECPHEKGIGISIRKKIDTTMKRDYPDYLQIICKDHRQFLEQLLVRTKLFHDCKRASKSIPKRTDGKKPHPKLRVLCHF